MAMPGSVGPTKEIERVSERGEGKGRRREKKERSTESPFS